MATRFAIVSHFLKVGAQLSAFECALAYLAPLAFLGCPAELPWLAWNAACQIAEFVPVVVLPAMLTGHMAYVDIGWPLGLVLLGANGLLYGTGFWLRRWLMSGCMLLHGGRMCFGALVLFYPYRWSEDLPRYVYAKHRFVTQDAMPENLWPLNVLACPIVLCCFDTAQDVHPVEWAGYAIWLCAWVWESVADSQKALFVQSLKGSEMASTAVLGHPPNAGWKYCLWTACEKHPAVMKPRPVGIPSAPTLRAAPRPSPSAYTVSTRHKSAFDPLCATGRHPNYFGEWVAWQGLIVAALPSLVRHAARWPVKLGLAVMMWALSRFLYDCLLHWTGAEPAEFYSHKKRRAYRDYQMHTRVFWPIELHFVDHGRRAGWPDRKRECHGE
jgi:steroid 5-alpha reductase family enzyme